MDIKFIQDLERLISEDLPGAAAQNLMKPPRREFQDFSDIQPTEACVLLLLYPKNNEWYTCFIERPSHYVHDVHAGQFALPGGKVDETDYSFEDCALRETYEEIGIPPEDIGILGSLTSLYIPVSNYLVHPFVGFMHKEPEFELQPNEVANLIEVPITFFPKSKYKSISDIIVRSAVIEQVPHYILPNQKKLWGATAMILSEFEHIIVDLEFD
ncbi:MAG: CoA pyrophosphatase [Saprospiraceae bacterium]